MSRIIINLTQESLLNLKTDACVSSIHCSKELDRGRLSKQISDAAGPNLQRNLKTSSHHQLKQYDVVEATPENLANKFKLVYFICLSTWKEGNGKHLQGAIERMLDDAGAKGLTSIALPPLGTGGLNYPPREAALAILQAVIAHNLDTPTTSITSIKVSVFEQKDEMLQAFTDILHNAVRMYDIATRGQQGTHQNDNNRREDQGKLFAQPVFTGTQPNMLQRVFSYFRRPMISYKFMIGPLVGGVSPYVSVSQGGLGGQLTVGLTFSVDALPVAVQQVLSLLSQKK